MARKRKPVFNLTSSDAFVQTLRTLRNDYSRYTQHEVCELLGVSRGTIANWETGVAEPAVHTMIALLALYGYELVARPKRKR